MPAWKSWNNTPRLSTACAKPGYLPGGTLWLAICAVLGFGCRTTFPAAHVECPQPEPPPCTALPWHGIRKDTTVRTDRPYWEVTPIEGLEQLERDELALHRLSEHTAWVTLAKEARQWVATVTLPDLRHAQGETSWDSPLPRIGMPTGIPRFLLFAGQDITDHPAESRIFVARLEGTQLSLDSALRWSSSSAWESQPALSPDGRVLFFAADYPTGYGGTDIYFAVRRADGSWAGPYNCGPSVNTPCNELTPSVSGDGRWLLFASNGHTTVGGYDLFACPILPAFWDWVRQGMPALPSDTALLQPWFGEAENLAPPVNTEFDDISPTAPGSPDSLLFWSSNRAGSFDLYVLVRHEALATPLSPTSERKPKVELRGQVVERETRRPLPGAEVRAHIPGTPRPVAETTTDTGGHYRLRVPAQTELEIIAQAGEAFFEVRRLVTGSADTVVPPLDVPARLFLRLNFPFDRYDQPYPYVLDTLGMETNLRWQQALDLLAENLLRHRGQLQRLVLVGHTDDIGSEEYNRWLGQKRVEFVISELVRRGVPPELLQGESAGRSQLLPRLPGEPLERWRKRCRRVELQKILRTP